MYHSKRKTKCLRKKCCKCFHCKANTKKAESNILAPPISTEQAKFNLLIKHIQTGFQVLLKLSTCHLQTDNLTEKLLILNPLNRGLSRGVFAKHSMHKINRGRNKISFFPSPPAIKNFLDKKLLLLFYVKAWNRKFSAIVQ